LNMSEICENKTKLDRDGTSRQQRLLNALLPEYVSIDERSMKDLIRFSKKLAGEIHYINSKNEEDGDWKDFLESDKDLEDFLSDQQQDEAAFLEYVKVKSGFTQPHIALFLAFLKIFKVAQDDLNQITKKHLDFYYKDVLQLKEEPAVADRVFLIFELARHVDKSYRIEKNTVLKAGKDELGQPLRYETDSELIANRGQVEQVKAVFADVTEEEASFRLFGSPEVNSADGRGAEIETEDMSWKTFGGPDREEVDIGFAVSSPALFLEEGLRTVSLTLHFDESDDSTEALKELAADQHPLITQAFKVVFSGEEEWISPADEELLLEREEEIPKEVEERILEFVNHASAEKIATKVKDDPTRGYAKVRKGYAIGIKVAEEIIKMRNEKGPFKKAWDLKDVFGLGQDKVYDLAYTFRDKTFSDKVDLDERTITITRTLDADQPPVVAYNRDSLADPVETTWPVMKVMLREESTDYVGPPRPSIYKLLRKLKLADVELTVDVEGLQTNIIQNDRTVMDPGKPFHPFGNRPVPESSFYIGNREIFQKSPDKIWIRFHWHDLPEESLGMYYAYYDPVDSAGSGSVNTSSDHPEFNGIRQNDSFKTEISVLENRSWKQIESSLTLFDSENNEEPPASEREFVITGNQLGEMKRNPGMDELTEFNTTTGRGFIRLRLRGTDFGHKAFAAAYTRQAIKEEGENLPKEPYTPMIRELSLSYTTKVKLNFSKAENNKSGYENYYHIHPFGIQKIETDSDSFPVVPIYNSEGNLYIGLSHFKGGQNISLLFRVAEGSANPDFLQQDVRWSYLSGGEWIDFEDHEMLSDSTNQLLNSGIISFRVPKKISQEHTILPGQLVWLRAAVDKDTPAISDLVDIRAQAVTASFADRNNDPNHLAEPLVAETISKLKDSDASIKNVIQPYASFGGAMKEESSTFYTRVSERLRHKRRAITIWDYERLILQKFPSVYKVKCLNHTRFEGSLKNYSEIAPGYVSLIVVSDMINQNAVDPLKPKTSLVTLTEIGQYLDKIKANNVQLFVRNPLYEEIMVDFNVKFRDGTDAGYYQGYLNEEIKSYLSPWAFQTTQDIVFGGRIHKSMILHFVETREYVDFVTCFKMYHIIPGEQENPAKKMDVNEVTPKTSASVLGSAPDHKIKVLETEECACDDNEVSAFSELEADNCGC
jgi:hypothetical protein